VLRCRVALVLHEIGAKKDQARIAVRLGHQRDAERNPGNQESVERANLERIAGVPGREY
jgi:hypothetical protein